MNFCRYFFFKKTFKLKCGKSFPGRCWKTQIVRTWSSGVRHFCSPLSSWKALIKYEIFCLNFFLFFCQSQLNLFFLKKKMKLSSLTKLVRFYPVTPPKVSHLLKKCELPFYVFRNKKTDKSTNSADACYLY